MYSVMLIMWLKGVKEASYFLVSQQWCHAVKYYQSESQKNSYTENSFASYLL